MAFPNSPGVYGREVIGDATAEPQVGFIGGAVISAKSGPVEPTLVTSEREFYNLYGEPTMDRPSMHVVARFLKSGNAATIRRVIVDAEAASATVQGEADPVLTFTAANPGSWGNDLRVVINASEDGASLYDIDVAMGDTVVEQFTVSLTDGDVDGFGQPRYIEDRINSRSRFVRVEHDSLETLTATDPVEVEFSGGQDDTSPVSDAELIEAIGDFRNTEEVQVNYFINAGWISAAVQAEMVSVMEERKDGVVILDTPDLTNAADIVEFRKSESNISSSFAAYYAGWIRILESTTGKEVIVPPSGDVAAVFAASQQGVIWDAPAGLRRGVINGALGVNKVWSEADRDLLYKAGVNPIQSFPGQGVVLWGQKTALGHAASTERLNVRFLLNYVRTTAIASLKPFVFQSNSSFTRSSIFALLDNFMAGIQANGGVYGYRVEIGEDLNTPQVIEGNQMLVNILVQPTRTAEFIRVDTITVPLSQDL